jgi:Phytanoyl-CoA dioxygenase (PhyH)
MVASGCGVLSDDEVRTYREIGYVIPEFAFKGAELDRLQSEVHQVVSDNPELVDEPIPFPHLAHTAVRSSGAIFEFITNPSVLDMMEQLIGPDFVLWQSAIFHKDPETGPATPWHQDGDYWPIEPMANASIWIAVEDVSKDNACLRFVPGTANILTHRQIESTGFSHVLDPDERDAVDIELKAGQLVVFDVAMVHGSRPNEGRRSRTALGARYMPTTSVYHHDRGFTKPGEARKPLFVDYYSRVPLFLVRGVDRSGQNDFTRNQPLSGVSSNG